MTYDPDLAARIRLTLQGRSVREVKMFGGLSFSSARCCDAKALIGHRCAASR